MHAPDEDKLHWQAFGVSAVGAHNLNRKQPKQDALHWLPVSGRGRRVALAVADGHGADRYFRSAKGAHYAVNVMTEVLREFVQSHARETDPTVLQHWALNELPALVCDRWRDEVKADLAKQPYEPDERASIGLPPNPDTYDWLTDKALEPYGCTLLGVATTDHYLLGLQLGDGNIAIMDAAGTGRFLFENPESVEKHSICQPTAPSLFRAVAIPLGPEPPVLVAANTDGFRNAFPSQEEFLRRGQEFLNGMRKLGLLAVVQNLHHWVNKRAMADPGDDISVGILYRIDDYHRHAQQRKNR
jgi:hypothetical protein